MFLGIYQVRLRAKNRVALPSKLRKITGDSLYITNWFDKSLLILPKNEWEKFTQDMLSKNSYLLPEARDLERFIFGGTVEVRLDREGRFVIPEKLIKYSGIEKNVIFAGGYWYISLWDETRYKNYQELTHLQIKDKAIKAYERLKK